MTAILIADAMQHLRAEPDDEVHVGLLLAAAEDSAEQYLNRRFYADADSMALAVLAGEAGLKPLVITPSIRAACLLILGSLFDNREDVVTGATVNELPMGSRSMLTPYRIGWGI